MSNKTQKQHIKEINKNSNNNYFKQNDHYYQEENL